MYVMERVVKDLLILLKKEEIEMILIALSNTSDTTAFEYACDGFVSRIDSDDFKNRFKMVKQNKEAFKKLEELHEKHIDEFFGKKGIAIEELGLIQKGEIIISAKKTRKEEKGWKRVAEIFNQSGSDRMVEDVRTELRKIRNENNKKRLK